MYERAVKQHPRTICSALVAATAARRWAQLIVATVRVKMKIEKANSAMLAAVPTRFQKCRDVSVLDLLVREAIGLMPPTPPLKLSSSRMSDGSRFQKTGKTQALDLCLPTRSVI